MNYIAMVKEFHQTMEHPVGNAVLLEHLKIRQLRIKLLFEELVELAEASDCMDTLGRLCDNQINRMASAEGGYVDGDEVDKVEELDALCDLMYVLCGKILTAGLHEVFDKAFELVHKNNMAKAHISTLHILETVKKKGWKEGEYSVIPKEGRFLLLDSNGKLTKPHNHSKVKLSI